MSDLIGIIRGLELGAAALHEATRVTPVNPAPAAPLSDESVDRSVTTSEIGYGPHTFAYDGVPAVDAPAGDALAGAMRAALADEPASQPASAGLDAGRIAGLLTEYAVPHTPTQATVLGAARLLQNLFGDHRTFATPALDAGGSLKTQDISGSIIDQSTGRFST